MTAYPPVTDASVRAAKLAQQRERDEVYRLTGIRIRDPWDSPATVEVVRVAQGPQHVPARQGEAGSSARRAALPGGMRDALLISDAIGRVVYGAECRREGQR